MNPVALVVGLVVASLIWALIRSVLRREVSMEPNKMQGTSKLSYRKLFTNVLDNCWSGGLGLATVRWAP